VVAPVLELEIEPVTLPTTAEALIRASIVVLINVPSLSVNVSEEFHVVSPSSDTCTPVGAATVTLAVRPAPLIV
jgi:hypothetical protein